jgi:NitT/TauT family transport system ATP-binding protein
MIEKLSVRQLFKRFATKTGFCEALANISFGVAPGEFIAFVGASGCGKSTLLRNRPAVAKSWSTGVR